MSSQTRWFWFAVAVIVLFLTILFGSVVPTLVIIAVIAAKAYLDRGT